MTSRERQLATIRHEMPDRIPVDAICIENQPEIAAFLGIESGDVCDRLGIDGRIVSAGYAGELPEAAQEGPVNEWGTAAATDYGTAHSYPLAGADTVAEVERYPWPDPGDYDYALAGSAARDWGDTYAVRGPYWQPLFCRVCSLMGMEEAMVKMMVQPAVFEATLDAVLGHMSEFCRRLLTACGDSMPILCLGDDFATQRGLMVPPAQWRRFLKPRFAKLFEIGKRAGKVVWFHSCGDITEILPDLIEIGVDVWETVQLHALPLSPRDLKREFGEHLTFFGGINTQRLPFTTLECVRAEVQERIVELGRGGGYICGPDHHIKPDVPPANAVALFDAALSFRGPSYTQA